MVTLNDIAARVGVSHAVVSCVLNRRLGKIRVSEARRQEIERVAAEMGYVPNPSARALATRRNKTLGLIVNRPHDPHQDSGAYTMSILSGLHDVCDPLGYRCLFTVADLQSPSRFDIPHFVRERSADGVLLAGYLHPEIEEQLLATGVPMAHIGTNTAPSSKLPRIAADMIAAACEQLDLAAAAGRQRFHLYLPSGPGPEAISAALLAYAAAHHPTLEVSAAHSNGSHQEFREVLAHGEALAALRQPPEVILASIPTASILSAPFFNAGLRCPQDVEFIFFAPSGQNVIYLGPKVQQASLILLPNHEIARHIARYLIHLPGQKLEIPSLLPCTFLPGESSASRQPEVEEDPSGLPPATPAPL